jgi:hypothetical protein
MSARLPIEEHQIYVHSVIFGGRGVEISYQESRKPNRVQTIILDPDTYDQDIRELLADVEALIDRFAVDERRPPGTLSR